MKDVTPTAVVGAHCCVLAFGDGFVTTNFRSRHLRYFFNLYEFEPAHLTPTVEAVLVNTLYTQPAPRPRSLLFFLVFTETSQKPSKGAEFVIFLVVDPG